jgi:hypothetical protein
MKTAVYWDAMPCGRWMVANVSEERTSVFRVAVLWRGKQQVPLKQRLRGYQTHHVTWHKTVIFMVPTITTQVSHSNTQTTYKPTSRPLLVVSEITLLVPGQEWVSNLIPRFKNNKPFSKCSTATLYLWTKKTQVHCQANAITSFQLHVIWISDFS